MTHDLAMMEASVADAREVEVEEPEAATEEEEEKDEEEEGGAGGGGEEDEDEDEEEEEEEEDDDDEEAVGTAALSADGLVLALGRSSFIGSGLSSSRRGVLSIARRVCK